jgi:opacity protein-like surface antigen
MRESEDSSYDEIFGKLQYVEFSVLAQYPLPFDLGPASPYIIAGPAVSLTMEAEVEVRGSDFTRITNIKEEIEGWDAGFLAGAGADFRINEKTKLMVELRYNLGLLNINDSEYISKDEIRNRNLSLIAGFTFPLQRY